MSGCICNGGRLSGILQYLTKNKPKARVALKSICVFYILDEQ